MSADKPTRSCGRSEAAFQAAQRVIAGGVNSPVRAFKAVGGTPAFISRGEGPYVYDIDGNRYIDYMMSWGALILGHSHPQVVEAVTKAARDGTSFGAPTERETRLAEIISRAMPSIERIRFVNSGTEATMTALRLARAYTGRRLAVKFAGCYHGHVDSLLVEAGSGVMTFSHFAAQAKKGPVSISPAKPSCPGIPAGVTADTVVARYNDTAGASELLKQRGEEIAAVIVEPVAGNMGVVAPASGFLSALRTLCDEKGIVLVFDEVITGFRVGWGGAQGLYGVRPDLTILGKIIGGGMPVGAYGGRKEIMALVSPEGGVYQAGTLAGNPVAMASGLATLEALSAPGTYERLERTSAGLGRSLSKIGFSCGIATTVNRVGSMMTMFFTKRDVRDQESALTSDTVTFGRFFHALLARGVYIAPSQFESRFVSTAHGPAEVEATVSAVTGAFQELCG